MSEEGKREELKNIEELLKAGKTVQFHPEGTSMWPLFRNTDDEALVVPLQVYRKNGRLKRSDVCLYRSSNSHLRLHRVFRVKEDKVWLVGDHQTEIEGPLDISSVYGIMACYIRKGRSRSCKNIFYRISYGFWLLLRPLRLRIINIGSHIKHIMIK